MNRTQLKAMVIIDPIERAALLKCRHAGRYDTIGKKVRKFATPAEAAEEQAAWNQEIPARVWLDLAKRGLIHRENQVYRLTDAGRAEIEPAKKGA